MGGSSLTTGSAFSYRTLPPLRTKRSSTARCIPVCMFRPLESQTRMRVSRASFLAISLLSVLVTPSVVNSELTQTEDQRRPEYLGESALSWGVDGPAVFPQPARLVAVGDLHGDLPAVRRILRVAGVLHPERDEWAGGKTVCVQVGDQLDRGDDELPILALLHKLSIEAEAAGGAMHVLLGNHETMTVMDQMQYGTKGAFAVFDEWDKGCAAGTTDAKYCELYKGSLECMEGDARCNANLGTEVPDWARARYLALRRGGVLSRGIFSRERRTFLIVGDTLFVHGGLLPDVLKMAGGQMGAEQLQKMNRDVADYIAGERPMPQWMDGNASPYWTRFYSQKSKDKTDGDGVTCRTMLETYAMLPNDVTRMVVGHTPQPEGMNEVCAGGVWRIDIGLSSGVLGGAAQALEILPDGEVNILREGLPPIPSVRGQRIPLAAAGLKKGGLWNAITDVFTRGGRMSQVGQYAHDEV